MITIKKYQTLQQAWEGLNEYMVLEAPKVIELGGATYGTQIISFENFVKVTRAWVDPEFDFGYIFGYTIRKWTSLINNYVDIPALELMKTQVQARLLKGSKAYNFTTHFTNSHSSGKDCLISLTFSQRVNMDHPVVTFHARVSELTKRTLFDFLLVQRMIEFVYGHHDVEVHYITPSFYLTAEAFSMYNNHRDIKKLFKKYSKANPGAPTIKFQERVLNKLEEFKTVDPSTIKYKVNLRSVNQVQLGEDGRPISGRAPLLAKDLKIC